MKMSDKHFWGKKFCSANEVMQHAPKNQIFFFLGTIGSFEHFLILMFSISSHQVHIKLSIMRSHQVPQCVNTQGSSCIFGMFPSSQCVFVIGVQ